MAVTRKAKPKKASKGKPAPPKTWRDALRLHLAKAPGVDAVFVSGAGETVHVYSVVKELREKYYKGLLEQEDLIEKAFPEVSFEFHTRPHQGRDPSESGPWGSDLVYLR
jgi:hypothetical protein